MTECYQRYSNGVLCLRIITHDIECRRKDISDIIRVGSISDYDNVSFRLANIGVRRVIICVGGWFGITFFIDNMYAVATSVVGVGVPFDAEAMRGVS